MENALADTIRKFCQTYPQVLVFLSIAIGYFIGKKKVYGFSLGSTAGVLLAALLLGQIDIKIPSLLKDVSFALFIFTIGYKVGPQFFGSLKKEGLKYIVLSTFFAVVALLTAIALGKFFNFDQGTAAGILGGALTQSSVIGTADGAISHLSVAGGEKSMLQSNVAVAYAITYIFGTAGLILFFKLVPTLMGINLRSDAKKLEIEMSGGDGPELERPELFSWFNQLDLRSYKVEKTKIVGKTIKELEALFPHHLTVDLIKRDGKVFEPEDKTVIQADDILGLIGPSKNFLDVEEIIGIEVDEKQVRDQVGEILKICLLNDQFVGKTLGELSEKHGRGLFLKKLTRQGHELPILKETILHKCDILQIAGLEEDVERAAKHLGYPERATSTTDLVLVGLGCILGTFLGLGAIRIFDIPITLGVGGGVLIAGLIGGFLRSLHPTFGQIPDAAQWIFTDLGLNLFIACVGLVAGPKAVHALQTMGASIFFAGTILTLTPHILSLLFGIFILRMNRVLLFGALTGAGTITAALNSLKEEADSSTPALGYTVPYALGNVFLTVWGTVLVNIL